MKDKIYISVEGFNSYFFKELFCDFKIENLTESNLSDINFKNRNVIFFNNIKIKESVGQSFFLNNNVIIFSSKKKKELFNKTYYKIKTFYAPLKVKKFLDNVKTHFYSTVIIYKDIKVLEGKIFNCKTSDFCQLTSLEKNILLEIIEHKKIKRDYFLENILKIKKNIETKTIESHLTRIRKKLLLIKSEIQIFSKDDVFYIEN